MDKDKIEIKKLKSEIRKLKRLMIVDELTEVLNRKGINDEVGTLFNEVIVLRNKKQKRKLHIDNFSLMFIDLDDFKKINDKYGHDVGDQVLKKFAHILCEEMRSIDIIGRFGGEEFVVAMLGATEIEAYRKADTMRESVKSGVVLSRHKELQVTMSVGVVSIDKVKPKNLKEFISFADKAMYEAKNNRGKDNVVKYSKISRH